MYTLQLIYILLSVHLLELNSILYTHTHLSENLHSTYNQINSQKIQVPTTMFIAVCTDPK